MKGRTGRVKVSCFFFNLSNYFIINEAINPISLNITFEFGVLAYECWSLQYVNRHSWHHFKAIVSYVDRYCKKEEIPSPCIPVSCESFTGTKS